MLNRGQGFLDAHQQPSVEAHNRVGTWWRRPTASSVPTWKECTRRGAHSQKVEIPGASHSVYRSHPKEVAALIEEARAKTPRARPLDRSRTLSERVPMTNFTPWSALAGGALIGLSASMLLMFNGRIAASVRCRRASSRRIEERAWRAWFLAGLLAGGFALSLAHPASFGATPVSMPLAIVGGLLVGYGTRRGGGCTSGHGVCGLSRLSVRSLVATGIFMVTGALSTFVVEHWASQW